MLEANTPIRLSLAVLYHQRQCSIEYFKILAAGAGKLKADFMDAVAKLIMPWMVPVVTPDEISHTIMESDLMGKHLILDPELCPWWRGDRKQIRRTGRGIKLGKKYR